MSISSAGVHGRSPLKTFMVLVMDASWVLSKMILEWLSISVSRRMVTRNPAISISRTIIVFKRVTQDLQNGDKCPDLLVVLTYWIFVQSCFKTLNTSILHKRDLRVLTQMHKHINRHFQTIRLSLTFWLGRGCCTRHAVLICWTHMPYRVLYEKTFMNENSYMKERKYILYNAYSCNINKRCL